MHTVGFGIISVCLCFVNTCIHICQAMRATAGVVAELITSTTGCSCNY